MGRTLFASVGGRIALPDEGLAMVDRQDGGNLVVYPAREVWERSDLTRQELVEWSLLVAATGRAMLDALPQLAGGCINYWEAGNWSLNDAAFPAGPKTPLEHRRVHLHLLGRSPNATSEAWKWGEAPAFPRFTARFAWAAHFRRLTADECHAVLLHVVRQLTTRYRLPRSRIVPTLQCASCGYPAPRDIDRDRAACSECQAD